MRLVLVLLCVAASASAFAPVASRCASARVAVSPAPDAAPRGRALLLRAEPREKREFDPVIGKAIAEKGGFFVAAIVLSVVFEKASQYLAAQ